MFNPLLFYIQVSGVTTRGAIAKNNIFEVQKCLLDIVFFLTTHNFHCIRRRVINIIPKKPTDTRQYSKL